MIGGVPVLRRGSLAPSGVFYQSSPFGEEGGPRTVVGWTVVALAKPPSRVGLGARSRPGGEQRQMPEAVDFKEWVSRQRPYDRETYGHARNTDLQDIVHQLGSDYEHIVNSTAVHRLQQKT